MPTSVGAVGWALLVLSAALALTYGLVSRDWYNAGVSHYTLAALKASGIVLLAALALTHRSHVLAAALAFGAAGDALLALDTQMSFIAGAGAFLVGHLFYIALLLSAGVGTAALRQPPRVLAMAAVITAAVAMTLLLVPRDNALFAPLSVYTGVLTLMTISSFTLPATRWLAMAGAVLFFISDGFVAANMFHPNPDPVAASGLNFSGWMIYWGGQAGLCVGALGLRRAIAT